MRQVAELLVSFYTIIAGMGEVVASGGLDKSPRRTAWLG